MTSLVEVYRRWPTHEACTRHLEQVRWGESPTCTFCGSPDAVSRHHEASKDRWQCSACKKSFSVTVGTIFHNTHINLQRWFLLINLILNAKKGLSSMQAARDIEIRQPTVWSMMHRVQRAMVDDKGLLAGIVEMDETWVARSSRDAVPRSNEKAHRGGKALERPWDRAIGDRSDGAPRGRDRWTNASTIP